MGAKAARGGNIENLKSDYISGDKTIQNKCDKCKKEEDVKTTSIQLYKACSSKEDTTISQDHEKALRMLDIAIKKLESYNGVNPSEVKTNLSKHFGESDGKMFAKWVKLNLQYLRLVAPLANYQCENVGESSWACSSENTLATTLWCVPLVDIRICPLYFSQSQSERCSTLIHEWVHKYGCNLDLGYEHEDSYSDNSTATQLFNADSFANFVRDVQ